jgi:hypothetical protein
VLAAISLATLGTSGGARRSARDPLDDQITMQLARRGGIDRHVQGLSAALDERNRGFWIAALALVGVVAAWLAIVLYLVTAHALGLAWPLGRSSFAEFIYLVSFFEAGPSGKDIAVIPVLGYLLYKLGQFARHLYRKHQALVDFARNVAQP